MKSPVCILPWLLFSLSFIVSATKDEPSQTEQHVITNSWGISLPFFASLERLSRLVDIAYCVGSTGLSSPFQCASRCKDFPALDLVTTWNTGMLMSDSCGYIAVDHDAPIGPPTVSGEPKGAIVVAFRGTYSIANTLADLSTVPQDYVPYPSPEDGGGNLPEEPEHRCSNCTVHTGFLSSWKAARQDVLPTVEPLRKKYPDYPIYLIGHSLGGAVAALAALEMKVILGWEDVVVTTFGEPRVGNAGFVDYLDAVFGLNELDSDVEKWIYRRLTHARDPIPLLPLSDWGYRSHAGEIYISKENLSPEPSDIWPCQGNYDTNCIAGSDGEDMELLDTMAEPVPRREEDNFRHPATRRNSWIPARYQLWQLFFAHRDYFWRIGLCVPGGDPIDWGRDRYPDLGPGSSEL